MSVSISDPIVPAGTPSNQVTAPPPQAVPLATLSAPPPAAPPPANTSTPVRHYTIRPATILLGVLVVIGLVMLLRKR